MKTCLIVDDSEENLIMLSTFLSATSLKILTAKSGMEAFQLLQKTSVEFIISDLEMDNGNGYWLLENLRTLPFNPRKIIFSGDFFADEQRLSDLGADAFIKKPGPLAEILKAMSL